MSQANKCDFDAYTAGRLTAEEVQAIAKAREVNERMIDAEAYRDGGAIRFARFGMGVVGRRPPRKRQIMPGPHGRKDRRGLVAVPQFG